MKLARLFGGLVVLLIAGNLSAQEIPNGNFEEWSGGSPVHWITDNLAILGVTPITQTTNAHAGSSAVRGEVKVLSTGDTLSPLLFSGNGDFLSSPTAGVPFVGHPDEISFWYSFTGVEGDQFGATAVLSRSGETIGAGGMELESTTGYTQVSIPIEYTTINQSDTITLLFTITPIDGDLPHPGSFFLLDDVTAGPPSAVSDANAKLELEQNFPNPFNPSTEIRFQLGEAGPATLVVRDMSGREMLRPVDRKLSAGEHSFRIDASSLPSGIYYYELTAEGQTLRKKMVLAK